MVAKSRADVLFLLVILCFAAWRFWFINDDLLQIVVKEEREISTLPLLIENIDRKNLKIPYIPRKCLLFGLLILCGDIETCLGPDYSIKELHALCKDRGLSFIHQNIRGLHTNFESLCSIIATHNIDIITLSEIHLSNSENLSLYKINGYDEVFRCRPEGKGGGVCVYLKNSICWERRHDLEKDSIESIWLELFFHKSHSVLLCCVYRPPNSSSYLSKTFNINFNDTLQTVTKETIIMGDCNANFTKDNDNREFKSILSLNGFKQLIRQPTRVTKESSTIIDIIASNKDNIKNVKVIPSTLSDHEMVGCLRKINYKQFPSKTIRCRNLTNYDPCALNRDLEHTDWDPVYNASTVNQCVDAFNNILETAFDNHAPTINKKIKGRLCPWLNPNLKAKMNDRDKLMRKAKKSSKDEDWLAYKQSRNRCNNLLRNAKANFHKEQLNVNGANPKRFWDCIKKIFPSKEKLSPPNTRNNLKLANTFSSWFASIITDLKRKTMPLKNFIWGRTTSKQKRTKKVFNFEYVSVVFVQKQLQQLKRSKATGLDNLPPSILKDTARVISKPLCHLINLSLKTGLFPSIWKKARIVPVFKSGNSSLPQNYRPISILPALSKIIEKAVHQQISKFLEHNNLLSNTQFGFRANRSTDMATILLCDSIRRQVGQGKFVGSVFLDLSRAFDTINHGKLINELTRYGISGLELDWVSDYLFDRHQTVDINKSLSPAEPLYCGVPQGTILGPLLFIIFFNDLSTQLKNSDIIQYADDTVIYLSHKNVDEISNLLNEDLDLISTYFNENELLMNLKKGKTESMLFGTSQRLAKLDTTLELYYRGQRIHNTDKYKYLGNVVDPALSLNLDFDQKYKKTSSRLRLLNKVRPFLNVIAAKKIFEAMIIPVITYCQSLHASMTRTQKSKLKSLTSRATNIIGNNISINDIETTMNIRTCLFVRKCMEKKLCDAFNEYFEVSDHSKATRNNKSLLILPRVRLEFERKSFYFFGAKIYNELPLDIRREINYIKFKQSLMQHKF